jgi:hypothetical protein
MKSENTASLVDKYLASHAVTICPPRKVPGADELEIWAAQRRFGAFRNAKARKRKQRKGRNVRR